MAWTQTDLDALDAAIASGALSVKYAGGETTYRSLAEMMQIRQVMAGQVQGSSQPRLRQVRLATGKGL